MLIDIQHHHLVCGFLNIDHRIILLDLNVSREQIMIRFEWSICWTSTCFCLSVLIQINIKMNDIIASWETRWTWIKFFFNDLPIWFRIETYQSSLRCFYLYAILIRWQVNCRIDLKASFYSCSLCRQYWLKWNIDKNLIDWRDYELSQKYKCRNTKK